MSLNNVLLRNGENQRGLSAIQSVENVQFDRRTSIPRQPSYDNMATSTEANVLVIYTGGTIGMTRNSNNGKWIFNLNNFFFV